MVAVRKAKPRKIRARGISQETVDARKAKNKKKVEAYLQKKREENQAKLDKEMKRLITYQKRFAALAKMSDKSISSVERKRAMLLTRQLINAHQANVDTLVLLVQPELSDDIFEFNLAIIRHNVRVVRTLANRGLNFILERSVGKVS